MTSPHIELGNSLSDVGSGTASFADGLVAARQRAQQIALNQALANSKIGLEDAQATHFDAQTGLVNEQTDTTRASRPGILDDLAGKSVQSHALGADAAAQAAQREQDALAADETDEGRLRQIVHSVPAGIFRGMNKGEANKYIATLAQAEALKSRLGIQQSMFENRGVPSTDLNGNVGVIYPNNPSRGFAAVEGAAKPTSGPDRTMAAKAQVAKDDHLALNQYEIGHPETMNEIAKAIAIPSIAHLAVGLIPGVGQPMEDVMQSMRLSGASPEAQAYLKRMFDFATTVGPTRYGLRGMSTPHTLQQLWTDFGAGQFDLSQTGIRAAQRNRENAIHQMETSAGPHAMGQSSDVFPTPSSTEPAPSPYGYRRP
jgi:hypothetical protein